MSLPEGAVFAPGALEKVSDALKALAKDIHAPRQISVDVVLNIHREYPKMLYKGAGTKHTISVPHEAAEKSARDSGYHEHMPDNPEEE